MPVSAETLRVLLDCGLSADDLVRVVAAIDADMANMSGGNSGGIPVDMMAEKRRAWDRDRKRALRDQAVSGGIPVDTMDPLPKEKRKVSPCTPSKEKTQPLPFSPGPSEEGPPPHGVSAGEMAEAVDAWNELADEAGLPMVRTLTDARRQALRRRLIEGGGIDGWRAAMGKIRGSTFLRGENDRGWRADFDFVLQAKSFAKLIEGAYSDQPGAKARASPQGSLMDEVDRVFGFGGKAPRDMGPVIEVEAER